MRFLAFTVALVIALPALAAQQLIMEGIGPLSADQVGSPSWPATGVDVGNPAALAGSAGSRWQLIWGNRCTADDCNGRSTSPNLGGNAITIGGAVHGWYFTDKAHADACTIAQAFATVGDLSGARDAVANAGLHGLFPGADPASLLNSGGNFVNVCNLQIPASPAATGIALDWEVCDGHTPKELARVGDTVRRIAKAHGLETMLYTNRLTAPCAADNGIAPGSWPLDHFDYVTLVAEGGTYRDVWNSLARQLRVLKPPPADMSRVLVQAQVGGASGAQLRAAGDYVQRKGLGGWILWKNGATGTAYYPNAATCVTAGTGCPS
jgi:hypothetical protein